MQKEALKIVFMGTPDFAIPSLKALLEAGYQVVGVITAPDREAGRGRRIRFSPVKEFALEHNLTLLQPIKLKDEDFLQQLKNLEAHLQVVVAFRMLPEQVWKMPPMGSFNLHASLLPQYRGAAPINHAIMNGEKVTGLTTFFLDDKIDTGRIIKQQKVSIGDDEDFGHLHDRMMKTGADLVLETVELIRKGETNAISQEEIKKGDGSLKPAPKIFRDDCLIDWTKPAYEIHNFIRGLSPYLGAHSFLNTGEGTVRMVKIFKSTVEQSGAKTIPGKIYYDQKHDLKVGTGDGLINIMELQLEGKRKMLAAELLRGFKLPPTAFLGK